MCIPVVDRFIRARIGAYVQRARKGRIRDESWREDGYPMRRVLVAQLEWSEGMIENSCIY